MIPSHYEGQFEFEVDEEGMIVLTCPADSRHRFKGRIDEQRVARALGEASGEQRLWCPYCGHRTTLTQLAPFLADRLEDASHRLAERVTADIVRSLTAQTRRMNRKFAASPLGLTAKVSVRPSPPVHVRPQPWEVTRLDLTCSRCGEKTAIYGRAAYCWQCGPLPEAQTAAEGLRALRGRLDLLDRSDLPDSLRDFLTDHGLHESLEWDAFVHGVALVEALLLSLYEQHVEQPKSRSRLEHWLLVLELPVDDWPALTSFIDAREVRNSIVHRGGRVDGVLHDRGIATNQQKGERLRITTTQARSLMNDLGALIDKIAAAPAPTDPNAG